MKKPLENGLNHDTLWGIVNQELTIFIANYIPLTIPLLHHNVSIHTHN